MIELGKVQCLNVVKIVDFGVYLGTSDEKVLLPKKQVPEGTEIGDALTVFVYRDSSDRLIATTKTPLITLGQLAMLKVVEISKIGAFLNWGLEKDLLLPFKEQRGKLNAGDTRLVALYVDKSDRLCATMHIYDYLSTDSGYVNDSHVEGYVFEINPKFGAFVAIDDKFLGMIPKDTMPAHIAVGDRIDGRVTQVRSDGKLVISTRQKAYIQMDEDSKVILKVLEEKGGVLDFNDKADPEVIKEHFDMSKNAFKRGVGRLLKEGKITIESDSIRMK
ncbi:MAG: S1 RNA-binding domain-containing protein [Lachnospiraceae bacterium]